jgi:hypothetical protein
MMHTKHDNDNRRNELKLAYLYMLIICRCGDSTCQLASAGKITLASPGLVRRHPLSCTGTCWLIGVVERKIFSYLNACVYLLVGSLVISVSNGLVRSNPGLFGLAESN